MSAENRQRLRAGTGADELENGVNILHVHKSNQLCSFPGDKMLPTVGLDAEYIAISFFWPYGL